MNRHLAAWFPRASPRHLRLWALVAVFGTVNQLTDPLVDATLSESLFYWITRFVAFVVLLWASDILVNRWLTTRMNVPAWLKPVVIVSAVALLPFAMVELFVESRVPLRSEYDDEELWSVSPLLAYLAEYATLASIVVPLHLVLWLIIDRKGDVVQTAGADEEQPPFLEKVPGIRADEVLALQAEEHYVRVFHSSRGSEGSEGSKGSELVHYRFGDAVREMPESLGTQVHRSWWVADRAVSAAERGARRWQLKLQSGHSVPVSDSFTKAARERGWLVRKRRR